MIVDCGVGDGGGGFFPRMRGVRGKVRRIFSNLSGFVVAWW